MMKGWQLYGWAYANDPINRFGGINMLNSYSSQEADTLFAELKEIVKKQKV